MQEQETWYSIAELSELYGLSVRTIRKYIHRGELGALKIGGRAGYKVSHRAWEQFVASRKVTHTAQRELDGSGLRR